MDLLTIVTVVLFIALIGLVVVFGVLMLRLMKTLEATTATISKLEPTIANVEEITSEIKPTVRKIEPIVDRVQLTLDSVNLEMMRVDGILEDVSHITGNAVNASEAVDTITSAPAKAVAGVANKVRERFGTKHASEESASLGEQRAAVEQALEDYKAVEELEELEDLGTSQTGYVEVEELADSKAPEGVAEGAANGE